jgi:hypothetical protein
MTDLLTFVLGVGGYSGVLISLAFLIAKDDIPVCYMPFLVFAPFLAAWGFYAFFYVVTYVMGFMLLVAESMINENVLLIAIASVFIMSQFALVLLILYRYAVGDKYMYVHQPEPEPEPEQEPEPEPEQEPELETADEESDSESESEDEEKFEDAPSTPIRPTLPTNSLNRNSPQLAPFGTPLQGAPIERAESTTLGWTVVERARAGSNVSDDSMPGLIPIEDTLAESKPKTDASAQEVKTDAVTQEKKED